MISLKNSVLTKNLCLSAVGMTLQLAGSICMIAATAGMIKEVNHQIRRALLEELEKQLGKD